jgi:hypothetical protein
MKFILRAITIEVFQGFSPSETRLLIKHKSKKAAIMRINTQKFEGK